MLFLCADIPSPVVVQSVLISAPERRHDVLEAHGVRWVSEDRRPSAVAMVRKCGRGGGSESGAGIGRLAIASRSSSLTVKNHEGTRSAVPPPARSPRQ